MLTQIEQYKYRNTNRKDGLSYWKCVSDTCSGSIKIVDLRDEIQVINEHNCTGEGMGHLFCFLRFLRLEREKVWSGQRCCRKY